MTNNLFTIKDDGSVYAEEPFIAKCGCASASNAINNIFRQAGINQSTLNQVKDSTNRLARKFITDNGYDKAVPALNSTVHAVIIHPQKGEALNIMNRKRTQIEIANDVKEILS